MLNKLQQLGAATIGTVQGLGRASLMLFGALWGRPRPVKSWPLYVKQFYVVGVLSLLIILVSGLFIGMVLALQGYTVLAKFGAEQRSAPSFNQLKTTVDPSRLSRSRSGDGTWRVLRPWFITGFISDG